jgi:hypothetical protein
MGTGRIVAAGAVAVMAVGAVSLSTVGQAKAATTATSPAPRAQATVSPVSHRAHMGSYGASRFAQAAAKLPAGLAGQLRKQLGITPEQFLADGQAGADAGKVIASLRADGVTVLGAKLDGTALTVTTRDAAGAAAAEADGASAVIGAAQPVKTVKAKALTSPADGTSPLLGGDLWAYLTDVSAGEGVICSTGFNGYSKSTGGREFLTAGHCADYQDSGAPAPANGVVYAATTDTDPVTLNTDPQIGPTPLGSLDQPSFQFRGGVDSGIVQVTDTKATPLPAVSTWGSAASGKTASLGVENSGTPVTVLAAAAAVTGEPVCHSGERTGWQCGTVQANYVPTEVSGDQGLTQEVDGFATNVCDLPGDSGGSFVSGQYALGVTSAGTFTPKSSSGAGANSCAGAGFTIGYPMVAAVANEQSAAQSAKDFELAVHVPVPVVTTATANVVTGGGAISGHLPAPFATGTPVSLSLDGHAKAVATANSSGNWSFSLTGLAAGVHSYTVTAGSGHSTASASGHFAGMKAPAIRGTVKVGVKVVAYPGAWPVTAPTYTYQWLANGRPVSGATGASYTIPASLAGTKLSVTVTAHKAGYSNAAGTSPAYTVAKGTFTVPVRPKLSGTPQVGKTLAVTRGTWSPAAAIAIRWYANGKPVAHATGTTLKLTTALKGETVGVTVTGSKAGYASATVWLAESAKVKA